MRKSSASSSLLKRCLPFFVLFALALGWHLVMHMYSSDDEIMRALTYDSLPRFMIERYFAWSTRIFTDTIFMILLRLPSIVWRILDSALYAFFSMAVSYLAGGRDKPPVRWLCVCGFCLYPFIDMISAGWIVTTCVYLWSCASLFFAAAASKKAFEAPSGRVNAGWWALAVLASLLAGSMEQSCCCLIVLGAACIVRSLSEKRFSWLYAIELAIGVCMLCLHMLSPALSIRDIEEAKGWFPDYATLSLAQRLEMGFSATMYHFLAEPSLLFLLFSSFLFTRILMKKRPALFVICGALPLLTCLIYGFGLGAGAFEALFPELWAVKNALGHYGTCPVWGDWDTFLPLFVMILNAICVCAALYCSFDAPKDRWACLLALCSAAGVRVAIGLSPTIWASGFRTFIILQFTFVYLTCRLASEMIEEKRSFPAGALPFAAIAAAAQYVTTLLQCNRLGI